MRDCVHVIVESTSRNWTAWFRDAPYAVCHGDDWASAVAILIDVHGGVSLNWKKIVVVEEASNDGHIEFLIPRANRPSILAAASVN